MERLGITEDQLESFMLEIYDRCQKLELGPDQIAKYLMETINITKIVFPSQIPNYIHTKKIEIEELEKQEKNKHEIISNLNKEISKLEENQKDLIENNNISVDAIKWYKDIREELTNMQIPFDDIQVFIQCLRGIKSERYDVNRVVTKFSEIINFNKLIDEQKETMHTNIHKIEQLKNNKKILEDRIGFIQLKLSKNQELENIGMGLKELKIIYNTIMEISKVNDIPPLEALKKFYNDLDEYDDIVGYKNVIEKLKNEISNITTQIANNRLILLSQQQIGTTLQHLFRIGILEHDIEEINSILVLGRFDYDSNKTIINKKILLSDLAEYRDIKLVIKSLEQKQTELTNSITELANQKIVLENYLDNIFKVVPYNIKEILMWIKKITIALEYPKILFIYLSSNSNKEGSNKDFKDNSVE